MRDLITCPHCSNEFPASAVFTHQLEEERKKIRKEQEDIVRKKIDNEVKSKLEDSKNEKEELTKQNESLQSQLLETNKLLRELKNQLTQKNIEMEKRLAEEEDKIRIQEKQKSDEMNRFKLLEYEKKIQDISKVNEELKRKLEQGSQQAQGEVLEEFLENTLKSVFIFDRIEPVPKGVKGADIVQVVNNKYGNSAGKIIWEFKRTKAWSNDWVVKLKSDKRAVNAEIAVLVTNILPSTIKGFGYHEGVWLVGYESIVGAATALRTVLLEKAIAKSASTNTEEKKDALFEYIHSAEFKNRVEAISESFRARKEEIDFEKRWFTKKWAKEEKTINMLLTNNSRLRGELEAIVGGDFNDVKEAELISLDGHTEGTEVIVEDRLL